MVFGCPFEANYTVVTLSHEFGRWKQLATSGFLAASVRQQDKDSWKEKVLRELDINPRGLEITFQYVHKMITENYRRLQQTPNAEHNLILRKFSSLLSYSLEISQKQVPSYPKQVNFHVSAKAQNKRVLRRAAKWFIQEAKTKGIPDTQNYWN